MKKIKTILICGLVMTGALLVYRPALASVEEMQSQVKVAAEEGAGYSKPQDPRVTVATIIRAALSLIGIIFIVLMLYAGALWMMSGGNEEQVTKAKNTIKASVIGLLVIIMAYSITIFVTYLATGGNRDVLKPGKSNSQNQPFSP